jgi:hypothetical protein
MRTIQSVQRIGQDIPETVLQFDLESRSVSLGEEKAEADIQAASESIFVFLRDAGVREFTADPGEMWRSQVACGDPTLAQLNRAKQELKKQREVRSLRRRRRVILDE